MANAYQSAYVYRDPEKLDISVLGKAMQYKQQNYDQNVAQTQQLVNQYAGTDLLKDVDKEYFGQRINTLVNFINESGTRDWSKKSIVNSIQNYIGGALDEKVINAIGSTKSYRNQMAAIEEIKKSKPELWSQQNQDFATRDLDRYLSSTEAGDKYQAQTYTNYKDVQKTILDNSKMLKDYGVEYHYDTVGGNAYFTRIGKKERIAPESAKEYLNMMMTPDMQNQLAIDGWYTYRNTEDKVLTEKYQGTLDATLDYNNKRKGELSLALLSAPNSKKAEIEQNIILLNKNIDDIRDKKQNQPSRNTLINQIYQQDFYNKNVSFLSYDRVIDTFVDDSGFKVAKFDHERQNDDRNYNQKINEFNYKSQQDLIDNQFKTENLGLAKRKLDIDEKTAGLKYDKETGQYVSTGSNLPVTDIVSEDGEVEKPDGFILAERDHQSNINIVGSTVAKELTTLINNPSQEKLKKTLDDSGLSEKNIIAGLVYKPDTYKNIYSLLSEDSKIAVDKARSSAMALKSVDKNLKSIRNDAQSIVKAIDTGQGKDNVKNIYDISNNGFIINDNGDVIKGSANNDKGHNIEATKVIAIYNSELAKGNLSKADEAKFKRLIKGEIATMKDSNGKPLEYGKKQDIYEKITYNDQAKGFGNTLGQTFITLGGPMKDVATKQMQWLQNGLNYINDTDEYKFGDNIRDNVSKKFDTYYNKRSVKDNILDWKNDFKRSNEDLNSIGVSDLKVKDKDGKVISVADMQSRWGKQNEAITRQLTDYKSDYNKAININTDNKIGKEMMPHIQALLPIGTQIQGNSNMQVIVDQRTGLATINASVKDGKEYETQSFQVKMDELPPQILSSIKIESDNKVYSANNPYAIKYNNSIELDTNREEYLKKIDYMSERERYEAMQNPPVNKTDIINKYTSIFGEEKMKEHQVEINKIIHTPINVSTEAMNGRWNIVLRQNDIREFMSEPQDETYDRNLMNQISQKMVTDLIEKKIKAVMGIKVN